MTATCPTCTKKLAGDLALQRETFRDRAGRLRSRNVVFHAMCSPSVLADLARMRLPARERRIEKSRAQGAFLSELHGDFVRLRADELANSVPPGEGPTRVLLWRARANWTLRPERAGEVPPPATRKRAGAAAARAPTTAVRPSPPPPARPRLAASAATMPALVRVRTAPAAEVPPRPRLGVTPKRVRVGALVVRVRWIKGHAYAYARRCIGAVRHAVPRYEDTCLGRLDDELARSGSADELTRAVAALARKRPRG